MMDTPIPWIGLAALIAMFVLPFLPTWLFEGPRTMKHWPRRYICGDRSASWTNDHNCAQEMVAADHRPLWGELRRPGQPDNIPRQLTIRRTTIARPKAR